MVRVETSVLIEQPVQTVFTFVSDIRNSPRWQTGLERVTVETTVSSETGARIRRLRRVAGLRVESVAEITAYKPNREFGIRSARGPFQFNAVYHFEAAGQGTLVTWRCEVKANGLYRFAMRLIGQVISIETEVSLVILKNLLEAESVSARANEPVLARLNAFDRATE